MEYEALLVSCFDPRMVGHVHNYMKQRGLEQKYSHLSLAGGALGIYMWRNRRLFLEHLNISVLVHRIRRVVMIDHRDCLLQMDHNFTAMNEEEAHKFAFTECLHDVTYQHSNLSFEGVLMDLDGRHEVLIKREV